MATGGVPYKANSRICIVCLEPLKGRRPKLLPCHHSFCSPCLNQLVAAEAKLLSQNRGAEEEDGQQAMGGTSPSLTCPTCRTVVTLPGGGVNELQANFYIEDDKDQDDPQTYLCDFCDGAEKAEFTCSSCANLFCVRCRRFHDKFCKSTNISLIPTDFGKSSPAKSKQVNVTTQDLSTSLLSSNFGKPSPAKPGKEETTLQNLAASSTLADFAKPLPAKPRLEDITLQDLAAQFANMASVFAQREENKVQEERTTATPQTETETSLQPKDLFSQFADIRSRLTQLEADKVQGERTVTGLQTQNTLLCRDLSAVHDKNSQLSAEVAAVRKEMASLKDEVRVQQREMTSLRDKQSLIFQDSEVVRSECDSLKKGYDTVKKDYDTLKKDHDTLKKDHDDLKKDHDTLKKDHDTLKKNHDTLEKNYDTLKKDHDTLKKDHDTLKKDHDTLKKDHDTLKKDHDTLKKDQEAAKKDVNNVKQEVSRLDKTQGGVDREFKSLQTALAQVQDRQTKGTSALTTLENRLARVTSPVAFHTTRSGSNKLTISQPQTVICGVVVFSVGGGYDNTTGVFTAPVSRLYCFLASTSPAVDDNTKTAALDIVCQDKDIGHLFAQGVGCSTAHCVVKVKVGEKVKLRSWHGDEGEGWECTFCEGWDTCFTGILLQCE